MKFTAKLRTTTAAWVFGAMIAAAPSLAMAEPIRIAFGDIATVESLHLLVAFERAREQGLELEVTYLKSEDIAAQAVVGGQADIGVGGPYSLIQKVNAPVRLFLQLSQLRFYPVVNSEFYQEWADLDGQDIAVHSRGSGTEAIMKLMADKHDISYASISYVPGAEVRTGALLQGNVKATIVDSSGKRILEQEAPGKFVFLPLDDVSATDEALFANTAFLEREPQSAAILIEAILSTWRDVAADPASILEMREQYNLLPDATPDMVADIVPYFTEAAALGMPLNGGGPDAARDDFDFYTISGALEGNAADLKVEDFWEFGPLDAVIAKLGAK